MSCDLIVGRMNAQTGKCRRDITSVFPWKAQQLFSNSDWSHAENQQKKRVLLVVYAKRFATNFIEKMKTNGRKIHPITGISTAMEPRIATTMKKTNTDKMY